jgi:hypothetical protein
MRRWHLEDWRKIYTRMESDWLALPWVARGLASDLIKYAKADGTLLDFGSEHPGEALARMLCSHRHEVKLVRAGVETLLRDGYLVAIGTRLIIKNHEAAQERLTPAARRKRKQREKEQGEIEEDDQPERVTSSVTKRVTVTGSGHAMSQGVESSRVESSRKEQQAQAAGAGGRDPRTTAAGSSSTTTWSMDTLWRDVLHKTPGDTWQWPDLKRRIEQAASLLVPRQPPDQYAKALIVAMPAFIEWAQQQGWSSCPTLRVRAMVEHFERLEDWVARGGPPPTATRLYPAGGRVAQPERRSTVPTAEESDADPLIREIEQAMREAKARKTTAP